MDFQENLRLAQEVIDFAMSGQILRIQPVLVSPDEFVLEPNYIKARRRTWGDDLRDNLKEGESLPDGVFSWHALRSYEESKAFVTKQNHPHYEAIRTQMRKGGDNLEEFLLTTLPDEYTDYYHDSTNDIDADLQCCMEARLVMGTAHKLFETVFRVYKSGGMPCGWEGKYPEGKLIVFTPQGNSQESD